MKYFFRKRYILCLCFFAAALFSCNKLLEIPSHPDDQLSDESVYADSANVMAALAGLYANLNVGGSNGSIFCFELTRFMGFYSDEIYSPGPGGNLDEFVNNAVTPTNGSAAGYWESSYKGIYQANALLHGLHDNGKLSGSLKKQAMGEAQVIRALYYFYLVNLYGAVPYVTSTDYNVTAKLPRSSEDSIYSLIISDLTKAIELLPVTYPSALRARNNQQSARALLARVYLYRKEWQKAAEMSGQVIGDTKYKLSDDLNKTFQEGSTEAILHVPSVATSGQIAEVSYLVPYYPDQVPLIALTPYQVNAFEPGDKRKTAWTGTTTITQGPVATTYYYSYKYKNFDLTATPREAFMFLRLSEQYLIRAEANAQLGLLNAARADLDQIRAHAGLSATTASTKEQLLLAIEHERQTELFCELAHRWFDLKRTGRAGPVLAPIKSSWDAKDTLLPVPQGERQNNPFLTQNPGYN